jgi:flagellar biosynthesis GTPase FlhF
LNGHTNTVKLLLEAKTDTSLKDDTGHNAEHYAAKAGYWNIVSAIRKHTQKSTQGNFESDESTSESETGITDLYFNQRFPKETITNQSRKFSLSVDGKNLESSFSNLTTKSPDKVIAVMGPTGAGKSTFIQKALGEEHIIVGHSLYSGELPRSLFTI